MWILKMLGWFCFIMFTMAVTGIGVYPWEQLMADFAWTARVTAIVLILLICIAVPFIFKNYQKRGENNISDIIVELFEIYGIPCIQFFLIIIFSCLNYRHETHKIIDSIAYGCFYSSIYIIFATILVFKSDEKYNLLKMNLVSVGILVITTYLIVPKVEMLGISEESLEQIAVYFYILVCSLPLLIYIYRCGTQYSSTMDQRAKNDIIEEETHNKLQLILANISQHLETINNCELSDTQLLLFNELKQRYRKETQALQYKYISEQNINNIENLNTDVQDLLNHITDINSKGNDKERDVIDINSFNI